jgi:C_GCAxxG_C_C family probable redox protein
VGQEKKGIRNEELIKAMAAFGGGIASTGNVCGILTGGVAFLSSLYGKDRPEGRDHPQLWRSTFKLAKKFEELAKNEGGINCRDIARVNWRDREAVKAFYTGQDSRRKICLRLVGETAAALGEILDRADEEAQ